MDELAQGVHDSDVATGLRIARELIEAGIPVFAAPPCPSGPFAPEGAAPCDRDGHAGGAEEYDLPGKWQMTVPSPVWLERWQPGWALGAVGGHVADFLDEDPRNGGTPTVDEVKGAGQWPTVFGIQSTPSGGSHYLISPIGRRKATGFMPGLDYQGGAPDGKGRGFVWIAPTVKRSKVDGVARPYDWAQEPDLEWLADFPNGDDSVDGIRLRLESYAARRTQATAEKRKRSGTEVRAYTMTQARAFCDITLNRLMAAEIGQIEERANDAACALSHFVPQFWSEEQAYDVLMAALGETAYDPKHPASRWTAEKFQGVLSGQAGRAPNDWYATVVPELPTPADVAGAVEAVTEDEVDALLAEMLGPEELIAQRPPRHLVRGLLTLDSESWLIGEPGSKKSFVALDIAAHVALGMPWQGRKVTQAPVVLIVAEGAGGIGKRVDAWGRTYGEGLTKEVFRVLPRPVQARDTVAWAVLVRACERIKAGLVVIDTQARVTVGLEENSATDMGVYVDAARAIRGATGACVLTVHHTGRRGGDARGSSAIDGAQDTELKVKPVRQAYAQILTEKQKDIEPALPIKIKFKSVDLGQDEEGDPVNSLVLVPNGQWLEGEMDDESLGALNAEQAREINPFSIRSEPEEWTKILTHHNARVQRWLLQALADVARGHGLTQGEWKRLVEEKVGKIAEWSNWNTPFQVITDGTGRPCSSGVVTKGATADRWTVDTVALDALKASHE